MSLASLQMARETQASQGGETVSSTAPVLIAAVSDVRRFARLLRGIGFEHKATMTITEAGFEVTVEQNRTLCAIAWIPSNLFQEFQYNPLPSSGDDDDQDLASCFEISLDALLQCLNIFGNAGGNIASELPSVGGSDRRKRPWAGDGVGGEEGGGGGRGKKEKKTAMRMTWLGPGSDVQMILKDEAAGPITTCDFILADPEDLINEVFNGDDRVLYLIMKSERFREALQDLPPTSDRITLIFSGPHTTPPLNVPTATVSSNQRRSSKARTGSFTIRAAGDFGETELDYPNDKDVMDKFVCQEESSYEYSYHAHHFALLSRALHQAKQICLQIEISGFLSVQIMMPTPEGANVGEHAGILEFKMHALTTDLD